MIRIIRILVRNAVGLPIALLVLTVFCLALLVEVIHEARERRRGMPSRFGLDAFAESNSGEPVALNEDPQLLRADSANRGPPGQH